MTHLDMTGYRLAPQQFTTAAEVRENAARVRAFRLQMLTIAKPAVQRTPSAINRPEVVLPPPSGLLTQILWPDEYTGNNFTRPTIRQVILAMADAWPMDRARIVGPERLDIVVRPRQLAIALAKRLTLASYPAIGRAFGGRDHSTIYYTVEKIAPVIEAAAADVADGSPLSVWVSASIEHFRRLHPGPQPRTKTGLFASVV